MILLVTSRFLYPFMLTFQLLTMRSAFSNGTFNVSTVRFYITFIGIILNLSMVYLHLKYQTTILPLPNVPWATSSFSYELSHFLILTLETFVLTLADIIVGPQSSLGVAPYVVFIPFVFILSFMIWIGYQNRPAFSLLVERLITIRDVIVWVANVQAMIMIIVFNQYDYVFLMAFIFFTIATCTTLLICKHEYKVKLIDSFQTRKYGHTHQTNLLLFMLDFSEGAEDSLEQGLLRNLYHRHVWNCIDGACPC